MKTIRVSAILVVFMLSGCGSHEGVFEPDCVAYEGDRIELRNGDFRWERFTDEKKLGKDGLPINPFPDFPKTGTYTMQNDRVVFKDELGVEFGAKNLVRHSKKFYLLSNHDADRYTSSGTMPDCALRLVSGDL